MVKIIRNDLLMSVFYMSLSGLYLMSFIKGLKIKSEIAFIL